MKYRKLAIALCLVGSSVGAYADTIDFGTIANPGTWDIRDLAWVPGSAGATFNTTYNFSLDRSGPVSVVLSLGAAMTGFSISGAWGSWNGTDTYTATGSLTAGDIYSFTVHGHDSSEWGGGGYGGHISGSPAPVPEPETLAMLLAGLGLIGLVSRRRNNTSVA